MRINVIMPSYLGNYPNGATNRVERFKRAVNSFFDQDYSDKKLIVVSDNCDKTKIVIDELEKQWKSENKYYLYKTERISFFPVAKQPHEPFTGNIRNAGIEIARIDSHKKDLVCYLDSDDVFLPGHLTTITNAFLNDTSLDWVYFNDNLATDRLLNYYSRDNILEFGKCGTSSIAHRVGVEVKWEDGYGHDWKFIQNLFAKYHLYKKIGNSGYIVCHISKGIDF